MKLGPVSSAVLVVGLLAGCAQSTGPAADAAATAAPRLAVTLAPGTPGGDGRIPYVDVTTVVEQVSVPAGAPLLRLPLVSSNVDTIATTLQDLQVQDADGPLQLAMHDDPESGLTFYRHWTASRAVKGPLTVRYRAPVTNAVGTRGAAPPLELRAEEGAVSAAGDTFLLLPEAAGPYRITLRWDLGHLPSGAQALSSLGLGDVELPAPATTDRLTRGYFMAGDIVRYPAEAKQADGFFAGLQGQPPFDGRALLDWTGQLYGKYVRFFRDQAPPPYGVFLRRNPVNPGGGFGLHGSFIATYGDATRLAPLKITLAHEMFHTWKFALDAPQGLISSWYGEGMAVYYARNLALRFGQITPDEFLHDLNTTAARYYTNALFATPNDQVPARFWADTRVRVLPYDRGSMYFAVLDTQLRKASRGARSLDDLLIRMLERRRAGQTVDHAAWVAELTSALGPDGAAELDAMLAGKLMVPDSDAFGPCFRRTVKKLRRYELGFEPKVLTETPRVVRGLVAGSAAARAGIRNGDQILQPVGQDGIQGDQEGLLTLQLRRDGSDLQIRYKPRGAAVDAFQWERVPAIPDSACAR
jgi:predicted metalloprotease with PDZ domain